MQVGAPRGAERWYIKDGVARDGRILARKFTGYFDSGAYTRLSSYASSRASVICRAPTRSRTSTPTSTASTPTGRRHGHAWVWYHRRRFRDRSAHGQGGGGGRDESDRPAYPQLLPRRRHEGPSPGSQNCALIECCQVVAEKARVSRCSSASRRPHRFARAGESVPGCRSIPLSISMAWSPASIPAAMLARAAMLRRPNRCRGIRCRPRPVRLARRSARGASAAVSQSADTAPPAFSAGRRHSTVPRQGAMRFSSISGFEEALMGLHRGRGFAAINYPIGMNLGGDPSQALVHSVPDGKFTVALSSIDLGQGMKSVTRQIAAETLWDSRRRRLRRHCRQRYRARTAWALSRRAARPRRQRGHPGCTGSARRDARSRRRRVGSRRCRPRHRWPRQHSRQWRAVEVDHHHGRVPGGAVQARPYGFGARHLSDPALGVHPERAR